ncbi:hypothetical protein J7K56_01525 [Candidatus Calescamantes bacterium]|nr:hypothetical protein [Candidatus Calescamantes bacterium]
MISYEDLVSLLAYSSNQTQVISLYLNVKRERVNENQHVTAFKDLVKKIPENKREKNKEILDKITYFLKYQFRRDNKNGLALFASPSPPLWKVLLLPEAVRDLLVIETHPYTKPLFAVVDRYRRFAVVLLDQTKTRILEVFMGDIEEKIEIKSEVPHEVKTSGWKGYGERIHNHIYNERLRHFHIVAQEVVSVWRRTHFDYLILGGVEENLVPFISFLPTFLQEKVIGKLSLPINAPLSEIIKKAVEMEKREKEVRIQKLIELIMEDKSREGLAAIGLSSVLKALNYYAVRELVVEEGFTEPGYICRGCGFLSIEKEICPYCRKKMESKEDIVEEAVEKAIAQDALVEYGREGILKDVKILGLLRFKVP